MKKFFGILFVLMLMSNTTFAMTFSQPVKIGRVSYLPTKGIIVENASYNTGKIIGTWEELGKTLKVYENGVARWGNETQGLYFYYDKYPSNVGGRNKNFPINIMVTSTISRIDNDKNIIFYLLRNDGHAAFARSYVLIGRLPDGEWVKYFDTVDIKKKYLGSGRESLTDVYCKGDKIIVEYNNGSYRKTSIGEFRFKWDEAAQWFGVEHIIY